MRSEQEPTVDVAQAAKILKVDIRTVQRMARKGLLQPTRETRAHKPREQRFALLAVVTAAETKEKKPDLEEVLHKALCAAAKAEAAQQGVEQLFNYLGINLQQLSTKADDVVQLFFEAQQLLREPTLVLSEAEVMRWARSFLGMHEAYFSLAEDVTAEPTLWKTYLDLAQRLSEEAPRHRFRIEKTLEAAYGYLEAGRRSLRASAFFFVRSRRGHDVAVKLFPDGRRSLDEGVINLLFPH